MSGNFENHKTLEENAQCDSDGSVGEFAREETCTKKIRKRAIRLLH